MKSKFSYLLPGILSLMLLIAYSASAQDDVLVPGLTNTIPNPNQDPNNYDEKPLLLEQDGYKRSALDSTVTFRSVVTPAKPKAAETKKPQAEGDPLNFNFLYYIIQKYKSTDLMLE